MENYNKIINKLDKVFVAEPVVSYELVFKYKNGQLIEILQSNWLKYLGYNTADIEKFESLRQSYNYLLSIIFDKSVDKNVFEDSILKIDNELESTLTQEIFFLTKQIGNSVKALNSYKQKKFKQALNLTYEVIVYCSFLIEKGLDNLIPRVIEQYINLSRIYFQMGEESKSYDIWRELFTYIMIRTKMDINGIVISTLKNNEVSQYLIETSIKDWLCICLRYTNQAGRISPEKEKMMFKQIFFPFIGSGVSALTLERKMLVEVINILNLYYDYDYEKFINYATKFIRKYQNIRYSELVVLLSIKISYALRNMPIIENKKETSVIKIKDYINKVMFIASPDKYDKNKLVEL